MVTTGRGCMLVVSFLCVCCLAGLSEDAWMYRGNPAHSGIYEAVGVVTLGGVKWKFHTGGMVISSPAVVQGKVYFGSSDGNFYAFSAESGAQQWKFDAKSRVP